MTAWVVQMIVGDRPQTAGDAVLLRGDNVSAVSGVNKCGGAKDRRAGLLMRLLGRMEITGGWCHIAKHMPGLDNTLADGISRWPEDKVHENGTILLTMTAGKKRISRHMVEKSSVYYCKQVTRGKIGRTDVATDEQSQRRNLA